MISGTPMLDNTAKVGGGDLDFCTSGTSILAQAKEERDNVKEIELPSISKYSTTSYGKKGREIDDLDLFIGMKSTKVQKYWFRFLSLFV